MTSATREREDPIPPNLRASLRGAWVSSRRPDLGAETWIFCGRLGGPYDIQAVGFLAERHEFADLRHMLRRADDQLIAAVQYQCEVKAAMDEFERERIALNPPAYGRSPAADFLADVREGAKGVPTPPDILLAERLFAAWEAFKRASRP